MTRPLLLAALLLAAATLQAAPLGIGDPAPELKVSSWIKGGPIDRLDPEKTYVVEFWATWCGPCRTSIPHLTELAHRFPEVTFIGMNVWERGDNIEEKVARFVEEMGDRMGYPVALDTDESHMATAWMQAADRNGIPAAFLVHQGKIVWIGHPMQQLDTLLEQIQDDSFDIEAVKRRADAEQRLNAFFQKAAEGADEQDLAEEGKALEALDKELGGIVPGGEPFETGTFIQMARFRTAMGAYQQALFSEADEEVIAARREEARATAPQNVDFDDIDQQVRAHADSLQENRRVLPVLNRYLAAVGEDGDEDAASELAARIEAFSIQSPDLLNGIAWDILTDEAVKNRDLDLATRLAKRAMDLTEEKDGAILDTYARALFDTGRMAEAIEVQRKAVALEPDETQLTETLERYLAAAAQAEPE